MDSLSGFKLIVSDWEVEHVRESTSKSGKSTGFYISVQRRSELFNILVQILKEQGFTRKFLETQSVQNFLTSRYTPHGAKNTKGWAFKIKYDWYKSIAKNFVGESKNIKYEDLNPIEEQKIEESIEENTLEENPDKTNKENKTDNIIAYEPNEEDKNKHSSTVIDREAALFLGYTEEEIKNMFGDVTYE